MIKSKWKNKFVDNKLLTIILNNKFEKNNNEASLNNNIILKKDSDDDTNFKTQSRSSIILKELLNDEIYIYNGNLFKKIQINKNMINQKLGQFYVTRKMPNHKKK